MKLTELQLSQFCEGLGIGAAAEKPDSSQVFVPAGARVMITPAADNGDTATITVVLLNVTQTEMAVLSTYPLHANDHFTVRVPASSHRLAQKNRYIVREIKPYATGMFIMTSRFDSTQTEIPRREPIVPAFVAPEPADHEDAHVREVEARLAKLSIG